MMLIDLNDETMWETDDDGVSFFAQVPFRHPSLPKDDLLTIAMVCKDAAFGPQDRQHAQHCLDRLSRRVGDMRRTSPRSTPICSRASIVWRQSSGGRAGYPTPWRLSSAPPPSARSTGKSHPITSSQS